VIVQTESEGRLVCACVYVCMKICRCVNIFSLISFLREVGL
jgi:hypothetical protein